MRKRPEGGLVKPGSRSGGPIRGRRRFVVGIAD